MGGKVKQERELREAWIRAHEEKHAMEYRAIILARVALDKRLEEMNELRKQIDHERGKYLPRDLYDKEHDAFRDSIYTKFDSLRETLSSRVSLLENSKSNLEGRMWAIGAMISLIVIVVNLALHFWGAK